MRSAALMKVLSLSMRIASRQLISFLAYSGTRTVPIVATEVSKTQQFDCMDIPAAACMGVMTSGSTGKSKLLWRSYASWASFLPSRTAFLAWMAIL